MAIEKFTPQKFFGRWAAAMVLVFATYNPFGLSYIDMITSPEPVSLPVLVLVGLVLLIGFVVFLRATLISIGAIGITLLLALLGTLVWLLVDFGIVDLGRTKVFTTIMLVIVATILAIGISWSHIRRRLSGQYDVDEAEE